MEKSAEYQVFMFYSSACIALNVLSAFHFIAVCACSCSWQEPAEL